MIKHLSEFTIYENQQGSCYEQIIEGTGSLGIKRDVEINLTRALDLFWHIHGMKRQNRNKIKTISIKKEKIVVLHLCLNIVMKTC